MQDFVNYVRTEMLTKMQQGMPASEGAIVALRRRTARRTAPATTSRAYIVEVMMQVILRTSRRFIMLAMG